MSIELDQQLFFTKRRSAYAQFPLRAPALYKGRAVRVIGHESLDCPNHKPLIIEFEKPKQGDPTHVNAEELEKLS